MDLKEIALNKSKKRHPWELVRVKVITHFIKELLDFNKEVVTILDVGSGDTFLIRELSKEFSNGSFYAIDIGYDSEYINTTNKEFQKQNISIQIFNDLTLAEETIQQPVDLVLLLDVIEHVPDDVQFLKELSDSRSINEKTIFLVTVPSYQNLFCSHDVFLGHYRRYNNKLLKRNISKANLRVMNMGYFFSILLIPRFFKVLLERRNSKGKNVKGIGNWEGGESVSKILKTILWFDFSISSFLRKLRIKLPGLSNFAICKKYV